jgi:HSP20 family molecular chaperone IbpA
MELPGEDKDDIQLNLTENQAEVKGKNFYKVIELPTQNIDMDKASSTFKNGVLQLTIPKKNITVGEDKRRIKIE